MASNACWGIEVGSGALKAVKLVRDGDSVTVVDVAVIPHKKPLSAPEVDEKETRRVALGQLISQHDLTKAQIAVSVPGNQSFARFANAIPATEPKQIPALVEYEAKQQIPFPLEEVQWDFQTFAEPDSPLISVGIFAIRTETVMDQLAKWQDVGRVPDIVTLNPLAVYNAVAYDQAFTEASPGTVIIDVGTTSTDLIIADGAKLWVRTFPIGGHQFTEALVTAYNVSYLKAEKLKSEAETSQAARQILQALRPVFSDLAQDVQRSIGYYTSQPQNREAKLTRVLCHGNTFNLPGLKKFLSQQLQLDVTMIEGYPRIAKFASPAIEAKFKAHAHELAPSIGLALQGLDLQTINANLVPMSLVRESMWRDKTKWFMAAAGIALLAGGAMFIKPLMNSSALGAGGRPAVIDDVRRQFDGLKSTWTAAEAEYQPHAKAAPTLALVDRRDVVPKILDDLGVLLASASDKASKMPGQTPAVVEFADFTTTYGAAEGSASFDPMGAPVAATGPQPIRATMTVRISRDSREADAFIEQQVLGWLKANHKRSGIYEISVDPKKLTYRFVGKSVVDDAGKVGTPTGGQPQAPSAPVGGPRGPMTPPSGTDPERRPGGPRMPGGLNPGGFGPGAGGGGGAMPTAQPIGDAEKVAPLPKLTPFVPGSVVSTYVVNWEMSFVGPQAAPEGQP